MTPAPSPLPSDIAAGYKAAFARTSTVRLEVRWYASAGSTMELASEAARARAPEGLVIGAEEQSAGRGRRGRRWTSPAGAGLYFSILLRPQPDPSLASSVLALITLTAGVAVREGILRAVALNPELKWPNDVMIDRRKLAGILAEGHDIGTTNQTIVLGVGINVLRGTYPAEVQSRATSLESELGHVPDRAVLFEEVLVALAAWYHRLRLGELNGILRAWRDASPSARGARVEWCDGHVSGVTADIDESGALLIATSTGITRVMSGEVTWL